MKKLQLILFALTLSLIGIGQTKVEKKEQRIETDLKAFDVDLYKGEFRGILVSGYEYPTIREGYYSVAFYLTYEEMVTLYEELINISNSKDEEEFKLSVRIIGVSAVKKKRSKIIFKHTYVAGNKKICCWYGYKTKIKHLKNDLELLKTNYKKYGE